MDDVTLAERPCMAGDARDAKRAAIVAIARAQFFRHGYGATSMSSIAALVGGSKTTLWSHFRSKEALFGAVVDEVVERYGLALSIDLPPDAPVADVLERFASALMATLLSTPVIELNRIVIGEAGRFAEPAAVMWERGPKKGKQRLAVFCEAAMNRGRLRRGDPMTVAQQFVALCQSGCYQRALLGFDPSPDADTIAHDVKAAVDSFMRSWGTG